MIDFNKSFASHPKAKYWSSKNAKKPNEVFKGTRNKYWFNCKICNHLFDISLYNISNSEQWCPYCSCNKLCESDECKICFNKSFLSNEKSKNWSKMNTENPRNIFKQSNKKYMFDCTKCNHEFSMTLSNIHKKRWCPYCSFPCKKLCNEFSCIICFNNSFYSNYNSLFWSNKNSIHPREVIKSSKFKFWFDCHECSHSFEASLDNIINGKWCPYCANLKLCDSDECKICFNKSFKSIDNSTNLIDKNINTRNIFRYSKQKLEFICNKCYNNFESSVHHISEGSWCPNCILKTENKLYEWLQQNFMNVKRQVKYNWCKNITTNKLLMYDFEINHTILIELDGPQHFRQISNWSSPGIQKERDKYKIKCAVENNKHIIHICQEDVYNNKNNWDIQLKNIINRLNTCSNYKCVLIGIDNNHFS
jgi:hypothetical protein